MKAPIAPATAGLSIKICPVTLHLHLQGGKLGLARGLGQVYPGLVSRPVAETVYGQAHLVGAKVGGTPHVPHTAKELVLSLADENVGVAELLVVLLLHPFKRVARLRGEVAQY